MGVSERCCICGRMVQSYDNPDPIRSGEEDCCTSCNQLVIKARRKWYDLPKAEAEAFVQRLRKMSYPELLKELE